MNVNSLDFFFCSILPSFLKTFSSLFRTIADCGRMDLNFIAQKPYNVRNIVMIAERSSVHTLCLSEEIPAFGTFPLEIQAFEASHSDQQMCGFRKRKKYAKPHVLMFVLNVFFFKHPREKKYLITGAFHEHLCVQHTNCTFNGWQHPV